MTERDTVSLPISASLVPQEISPVNPAVIGSVVVESDNYNSRIVMFITVQLIIQTWHNKKKTETTTARETTPSSKEKEKNCQ